MRENEFKTKDEAELFLLKDLQKAFPEIDINIIAKFVDETGIVEVVKTKPPIGIGRPPVLNKRFVIKNDDLQFFDSIFAGILSSASAGFFLSGNGVTSTTISSSILGIAVAIFKLGRNAYNKRIQIEDRCFKVLATIHNNELTFDELLGDLERQDSTWTGEELKTTLDFLGKIPSFDGTSKQLVIQTSEEKWRTSGL